MKDLRKAAAETTQAAAERGADLVQDAIAKIQPLVEQAGEKVAPIAHEAKVRTADLASRKLDQIQPALNEALDKVTPAVDSARLKVQNELLPRLQDILYDAAERPDPAVDEKKARKARRRTRNRKVLKFVTISAAVAGLVAAVRQFLTTTDDGWTAHQPSNAYVNNTDNFAEAEADQDESTPVEVAASAEETGTSTSETSSAKGYGEGAYVGQQPPAEYVIKGNERSMKYHLPGTGGFDRTIPDVWFATEAAAEAAGFTRAQR